MITWAVELVDWKMECSWAFEASSGEDNMFSQNIMCECNLNTFWRVMIPCLVNVLWSLVFPLLAAYFDLALILLCSNAQNKWAVMLHAGVPESELLEFNYAKSRFHLSLAIKDQMQEMIVQPQEHYARKLNGWQWSNQRMFGPLLYRLRREFYYLVIAFISNTILFNRKLVILPV